MKVAVDIDVLANDARTGVYFHLQRLLNTLLDSDATNEYSMVYLGKTRTKAELGLTKSAKVRHVGWMPRRLFNLSLRTPFGLPFDLVSGVDADLYLFTKFVRWPLWRRRKSLVIVYDTGYYDYPEAIATWYFRRYLSWAVPRGIKKADGVIAISQSTKRSLMEHYGVEDSKISVITPAVDHQMFKPASADEIARVRAKYGITQPYVLSLCTLEPRKNLVSLLRAFDLVPGHIKKDFTLVLAGGKGWLDGELNDLYEVLKEQLTIIKTGYVAEEDLPALYSGASVFVFPPLFEGFGMPPLEAMACGTPVVTSDNSSLPEVVEGAGIMVPALDVEALSAAVTDVLTNPKKAATMREAGLKKAATFTWEAEAAKLKALIERTGKR
jgi:glycosyltransferase involved in cell wall biosynthesis